MRKPLSVFVKTFLLWVAMTAILGACATTPTTPISALGPEAQKVAGALEKWPEAPTGGPGIRRPFFTTIHVAGKRTTASGILDYHNPRDFRITAVTEMGVVLFDARINWAGATVLRSMNGLDHTIVAMFIQDLSRAMQLPESLNGLVEKGGLFVLKHAGSDTYKYIWEFDPGTGQLRHSQVGLGPFDTLQVDYLRYNTRGWPLEIAVNRKARAYSIRFTFTDNDNLAQKDQQEIVQ